MSYGALLSDGTTGIGSRPCDLSAWDKRNEGSNHCLVKFLNFDVDH
jgi:hypothetical protein